MNLWIYDFITGMAVLPYIVNDSRAIFLVVFWSNIHIKRKSCLNYIFDTWNCIIYIWFQRDMRLLCDQSAHKVSMVFSGNDDATLHNSLIIYLYQSIIHSTQRYECFWVVVSFKLSTWMRGVSEAAAIFTWFILQNFTNSRFVDNNIEYIYFLRGVQFAFDARAEWNCSTIQSIFNIDSRCTNGRKFNWDLMEFIEVMAGQ